LDYQQRLICSGSKTITNDSFELLQMPFSLVVVSRPPDSEGTLL
jgi:hypothetical protein